MGQVNLAAKLALTPEHARVTTWAALPLALSLVTAASGRASGSQRAGEGSEPAARWRRVLSEDAPAPDRLAARHALSKRQVAAAIALLRSGHAEEVWPLLRHSSDPGLRSYLVRDIGRSGVDPELLVRRLEIEADVSVRRALKPYPTETDAPVREDREDHPLTVSSSHPRPRRGGSFTYGASFVRCAHRGADGGYIPDERRDSVGFRVARTIR